MKKASLFLAAASGLLALMLCVSAPSALAKERGGSGGAAAADNDSPPIGSIRPQGKLSATGRLALAKITFARAFNAALAARPGKVVYGELEVDDGNLDYDFLIVRPDGRVAEVQIDARDGRVLAVDDDADNV